MKSQLNDQPFRVAFPYSTELKDFDPARVQVAPQYIFLENIYSTLLMKSSTGDLVGGIASRFYWSGDEIHFEIRPQTKASDGTSITAEDVAFSFKRLLRLGRLARKTVRLAS